MILIFFLMSTNTACPFNIVLVFRFKDRSWSTHFFLTQKTFWFLNVLLGASKLGRRMLIKFPIFCQSFKELPHMVAPVKCWCYKAFSCFDNRRMALISFYPLCEISVDLNVSMFVWKRP